METKQCTKCKEIKQLELFPPNKGFKGKRSTWCRSCHNAYCSEPIHLQQNRDRRRELRKNPEYRKMEQVREKIRREGKFKETWLVHLRQQAKVRNMEFDLTLEDLPDIPKVCPILKTPFVKYTWSAVSVDRIDSTKGYIKGNIQIISRMANAMKSHATIEQLIQFSKYWIKMTKSLK